MAEPRLNRVSPLDDPQFVAPPDLPLNLVQPGVPPANVLESPSGTSALAPPSWDDPQTPGFLPPVPLPRSARDLDDEPEPTEHSPSSDEDDAVRKNS